MKCISLICFLAMLCVSCVASPINSLGVKEDDSRSITVGDRCSIVPLTQDAKNECLSVQANFAGRIPQQTVFAISAKGPDTWTATVAIELLDADGSLCKLSFTQNGVAECGRFIMSDEDVIRVVVSASPNIPTGVSLTLETSGE